MVLVSARKLAPIPDLSLHFIFITKSCRAKRLPSPFPPYPVSKRKNGFSGKPCNSCLKFSGAPVLFGSSKLFFYGFLSRR